ncbi:hypothetical protein KCMC57_up48710 [Kitasatospora sp. CMC57]|uniref:Uncharacterized protein n=1 Tax=Kitasatospora sp. CMC57 TaxID=3231513 RepID=A0AB33KAS5_9ACTN
MGLTGRAVGEGTMDSGVEEGEEISVTGPGQPPTRARPPNGAVVSQHVDQVCQALREPG